MSKKNKRRACPAAGHEITAAECGEGRGSRYACPADCPFSPFANANYRRFLELECGVDDAALRWLAGDATHRSELIQAQQRATESKGSQEFHAVAMWHLFFQADTEGRTCAQRWERAGFPGLDNDGRVLMRRMMMSLRIELMEIHRVLDDEQVEVVDLLEAEPKPFIVRDRSLAASASRFACGLTWIYRAPRFGRLTGNALMLPDVGLWPARDVVLEIVRHLGGPTEEVPLRRWLSEHYPRFERALTAVGLERRRLLLESLDAKFGKAVYELQRPFLDCRNLIDQIREVEADSLSAGERQEGFADARVWFAAKAEPGSAADKDRGPKPVLGRVLLGQAHWRLETLGAEALADLRQRFEQHMGSSVRFTGERTDDLAQSLQEKEPQVDASLVPPRLLEAPTRIDISASVMPTSIAPLTPEEYANEAQAVWERRFLEEPVPALDGRTPREAAKDPALRPKLIGLMKQRVRACDVRNLETGGDHDLNWMLRELGLEEILFDPPLPGRRRHRPEPEASPDEEEEEEDWDPVVDENLALEMDPTLPPAPQVPSRPFTEVELNRRVEDALRNSETMAEALEKAAKVGCTLLDDVSEVTEGLVADRHLPLLMPLLLVVWRVFVPAGTRGRNVTRADLRESIARDAEALHRALQQRSPRALADYLEDSSQPALTELLLQQLTHLIEHLPKQEAPTAEEQAVLGNVLRAVTEALHRANCR